MITLICAVLLLAAGYFLYGKLAERVFRPDNRPTPAAAHPDGVDYIPMKTWRVFLIQLLNIAGTGPIFGALLGAVFGPVVFLWIVFGSILGGAVHDYMSGMISLRMDGASVSEIVGAYLGPAAKQVMRVFSLVLLVLLGAVFTTSPALLIARLTPSWMNADFWVVVILVYYVLATLLPIDKLIGKLYPIFGTVLLLMAVGIIVGLVAGGYHLPELTLINQNPTGRPVWPFMFITVACGAISGFHGTQSPMMARCLTSEKDGRKIFYGAMIAESVIALVWAAAGVAFYGATGGLQAALTELGQSGTVYEISVSLLGTFGGALAIVGVVVCPISSGDTAFRSARLTIADWFPHRPVEPSQTTGGDAAAAGSRCRSDPGGLRRGLALLLLEQPDPGHDYPVGCGHVSGTSRRQTAVFPHVRPSSCIHVQRVMCLYFDGRRGLSPLRCHFLPGGHRLCGGLRGGLRIQNLRKKGGTPVKRWIAGFCALLCALSLAGCGKKKPSPRRKRPLWILRWRGKRWPTSCRWPRRIFSRCGPSRLRRRRKASA